MAHSTRTVPILVASVIAVALVGGAFVLSGPIPFIDRVTAESSEELLRAYAVKDSDADGLTDWQESLYGTDPANPNSFRADLLDGEAARQELLTPKPLATKQDLSQDLPGADPVPDSLTDRFSRKLLERYLLTRGEEPPTDEQVATFVSDAINELIEEGIASPEFDRSDARIRSGNDAAAFAAYLKEGQAIFDTYEPVEDRDVAYIRAVIEENDPKAIEQLKETSEAYERLAHKLIELPVPSSARDAHVAMANAAMYLSVATGDIAAASDDPIRVLLGIGEYREAVRLVVEALAALYDPMMQSGVGIRNTDPEYDFYSTVLIAPTSLNRLRAEQNPQ